MESLQLNVKDFNKCHTPALRLPLNLVNNFRDAWVVVEFTSWYKISKWWLGHMILCKPLSFCHLPW